MNLINPFRVFYSPISFFQDKEFEKSPLTTIIVVFISGVIFSIEAVEEQLAKGKVVPFLEPMLVDWQSFWLWCIPIALLSMLGFWFIRGWWYRMRLKMSGIKEATPMQARYLLSYAHLTYAFPMLIVYFAVSFKYANPELALTQDLISSGFFVFTMPFSYLISWLGVKSYYNQSNFKITLWFLILPMLTSAITIYYIVFALLTLSQG